jgi:hypothetical protein
MDEQQHPQSIFVSTPLEQVREGMAVIDADGRSLWLGDPPPDGRSAGGYQRGQRAVNVGRTRCAPGASGRDPGWRGSTWIALGAVT